MDHFIIKVWCCCVYFCCYSFKKKCIHEQNCKFYSVDCSFSSCLLRPACSCDVPHARFACEPEFHITSFLHSLSNISLIVCDLTTDILSMTRREPVIAALYATNGCEPFASHYINCIISSLNLVDT